MRVIGVMDDQTYIDEDIKIIKEIINNCEHKCDLYLLDINAPKDGVSLAGEIKQKYPDAPIVFVTSHDELIFNALHTFPFYFVKNDTKKNSYMY